MRIEKLRLYQFRNYLNETISFSKNINIFVGHNAQGKTNLLESLFFVSLLKSFRHHGNKELFFFEKDVFSISIQFSRKYERHDLHVAYQKRERVLSIDGQHFNKMNEFIGYLNVVVFTPDDLHLVKGAPGDRRRLVDIELSKISPVYLYELSKFYHVLKQRNKLLKRGVDYHDLHLAVIDEQLVDLQLKIFKRRELFLSRLNKRMTLIYDELSNGESCYFEYQSFLHDYSHDREVLLKCYESSFKRDCHLKSTSIGIHRDDLVFYVEGKRASDYASQGQQRSVVLALKIALVELIQDEIGEYPILLLDDVLSELDDLRKNRLFDLFRNDIQTFITTTSLDGIDREVLFNSDVFHVSQGSIKKEDNNGR